MLKKDPSIIIQDEFSRGNFFLNTIENSSLPKNSQVLHLISKYITICNPSSQKLIVLLIQLDAKLLLSVHYRIIK
jgi:hypothetical protein